MFTVERWVTSREMCMEWNGIKHDGLVLKLEDLTRKITVSGVHK